MVAVLPDRAREVDRSVACPFGHVLPDKAYGVPTPLVASETLQVLVIRFVEPRDAEDALPTPGVAFRDLVRGIVQDDRTTIFRWQHAD